MSIFYKECKISIIYYFLDLIIWVFWVCYSCNNEYMIKIYLDVCDERKYKVDYIYMKNIIFFKEFFLVKIIRLI